MASLIKVQVYLDQQMIDWLQERAAAEHLKVSQVARRVIAKEMEAGQEVDNRTEVVTNDQQTNVQ